MVRGFLEDKGYEVVGEATDGAEAVAMTRSLQPDVVLMDIEMPDIDGLEAARRISETCPTPVVVLTAYETSELIERASECGVGAYLVKPSTARDIDRAITVALARHNDLMELRRLNSELEAQNADLDAFAHTVAHDLKSPLALIVGLADILITYYTDQLDSSIQECLQMVLQNAFKTSNVVDELLLLAEIRNTAAIIVPLDMAPIVAEARQRMEHLIDSHQAKLDSPDTWPRALGYGPWIEEVWVNYISNAVQYGGPQPHVELGATEHTDGTVSFWVRDTGPGIPEEAQSELFSPFTQLQQVRTSGYGLGLSITRRIVEKLGGHVGVESKVGQGSTFFFTLPSASDPA
jgi:signal transduction histidine kinase